MDYEEKGGECGPPVMHGVSLPTSNVDKNMNDLVHKFAGARNIFHEDMDNHPAIQAELRSPLSAKSESR